MKAKETTMKQPQINAKLGEWERVHSIYDPFHYVFLLEAQAEITAPIFFEEGRKAGIKEVVEWAKEECPHLLPRYTNRELKRDCPKCWQAKLKDWGI